VHDLTFEPPRGCQICHHQRPAAAKCATCHRSNELLEPERVTVQVQVPSHAPRARSVGFEHAAHREIACVECHDTPVTLEPKPAAAACTACHADHHAAGRDCAGCHRTEQIAQAHAPPVDAHQACAACHTAETVASLQPSRSFCLTCHDARVNHYAPRECTVCHLQSAPEEYRPRLSRRSPG